MRRKDGRIEPGQSLRGAISARAWNRAQDAADVVLGQRPGFMAVQSAGFLVLGKTSAAWSKGTAQNITLYGGQPGSEAATSSIVRAWNKFSAVSANRWVMLARIGDHWYLMAAECP